MSKQDKVSVMVALTEHQIHLLLNVTLEVEKLPEEEKQTLASAREQLKIALWALNNPPPARGKL